MTREGRIFTSCLIVVLVFVASFAGLVTGNFLMTLAVVGIGLICWLMYLVAADLGATAADSDGTGPGLAMARVIAGLGVILALSAFRTYGMEQTIFGGYTFNLLGPALAIAVFVVAILPLVIMRLTGKQATKVAKPEAPVAPPYPAPMAGDDYPEEYDEDYEEEDEEDWEEDEEEYDDEDEEEEYDEEKEYDEEEEVEGEEDDQEDEEES
ncbi:MAG: hypothetical protein V3W14_00345 [Candidatus Neomarinimicrobiota bacterium]